MSISGVRRRHAGGPLSILAVVGGLLLTTLLPGVEAAHAADAPSPAAETGVLRATLTNGLRVVVVRDPLAPVVATSVNYLVGSDETPPGFPGTAHAQEHMMFRGSDGLTADQLADIGSIMGGNFNANTREDLTQYLFTVPAEDLDVALHIEATRMRSVLDSQKEWDEERGAIEQEVAQDVSEPGFKLYSKVRASMFAGTPYEFDALGTRPSFEKTTAKALKSFHDTWYAPNNALLIVVGDVDPRATMTEVKELFGDLKPKPLPARPKVHLHPVKPGSFSVDTDRPSGTLMIAFRTPGPTDPDFPALEVLADVLSSHRYELFGLVPQGKAFDAEFALDPLPQAGMAYATVSFPATANAKDIEQDTRAILAKVAREGVPADLVNAAMIQERSSAQFQKNSIADLASVWSEALTLYGLNSPDDDLARIEKVTVADVNRVARKYLDLDHAIAGVMTPKGSGRPVASHGGGFGGRESIALGEAKPTKLPVWADKALHRTEVPPSTLHPVVSTLPNGLTLIVQTEEVSDTVSVFGHIRSRPETEEPKGQEGITQILDQLLTYGSEKLDRVAFQEALDAIGAREEAGPDFSVQMLADQFDRGVQLLADNELHPGLPEPAMQVIQAKVTQAVAARNKSPGFLTQHSLREALYPTDDPSLRMATPETVKSLTLNDIRNYYKTVFRPDLATIVVIGKITPEQARDTITRYFGGWTASGPQPSIDLPVAPSNKPGQIAVPDESRVQDMVILAQNLALKRSDPDYYALSLGDAVLGGSFYSTRLSIDLRKNSGLVYSVESVLQAGRTRGAYVVEYASDPQNVGKAANMVTQELTTMQNAPPTDDELLRVKALLVRQIPLSESSVDEIAHGILGRVDVGVPLDEPTTAARRYIELQPTDVQNAFKKWIRPNDMVRVSEGPTPQ